MFGFFKSFLGVILSSLKGIFFKSSSKNDFAFSFHVVVSNILSWEVCRNKVFFQKFKTKLATVLQVGVVMVLNSCLDSFGWGLVAGPCPWVHCPPHHHQCPRGHPQGPLPWGAPGYLRTRASLVRHHVGQIDL